MENLSAEEINERLERGNMADLRRRCQELALQVGTEYSLVPLLEEEMTDCTTEGF